jgi:hypothetical protein
MPFTAFDSMVRQSTSHQRLLVVIRPACCAMSAARCGGTTFSTSPFTSSSSSLTVRAVAVDRDRARVAAVFERALVKVGPGALEQTGLGSDVRIGVEHQHLGARPWRA